MTDKKRVRAKGRGRKPTQNARVQPSAAQVADWFARRDRAISAYVAGEKVAWITATFDVSQWALYRACRDLGIPSRGTGRPLDRPIVEVQLTGRSPLRDEAYRLRCAGIEPAHIAALLGVPIKTVYRAVYARRLRGRAA